MARDALRALRRHQVPAWWRDAKFGIFVHWTPAAVPGWAPVDSNIGELLANRNPEALAENPYTEWYENSLRFEHSSASRFHADTYGTRPYSSFVDDFVDGLSQWDPHDWARQFAATGARYVVLVAKHHDGWCLWPTEIVNPHRAGWHSERDIVGELREAVLAEGMRFGLYYSGGLDWTFDDRPIGNLGDLLAAIPRGDYPSYAEAQVRELIDRYRPSVLWNDIAWPAQGARLWPMLADYYRDVPDGVINDRWMPWVSPMAAMKLPPMRLAADALNARATRSEGGLIPPKPPHFDVRTPEYMVFDDVQPDPWECVRGMDHSFGYNRNSEPEHFLTAEHLVATAADIVAKGGNLLLNVGPRGEDAAIPPQQQTLLGALGDWTDGAGRSAVGSRPWVYSHARSGEGHDLRFWAKDRSVFVAASASSPDRVDPENPVSAGSGPATEQMTVAEIGITPTTTVHDADGAVVHFSPAVHGGVEFRWSPPHPWAVLELRDVTATAAS